MTFEEPIIVNSKTLILFLYGHSEVTSEMTHRAGLPELNMNNKTLDQQLNTSWGWSTQKVRVLPHKHKQPTWLFLDCCLRCDPGL